MPLKLLVPVEQRQRAVHARLELIEALPVDLRAHRRLVE